MSDETPKIAIFHDYIGAIGGGERLVLTLARSLKADVISTDVNFESIKKMGFEDVNVITLGDVLKIAPFKQIHTTIKFYCCNFPGYDFYIFSGNWAHYAAAKHQPNLWYCHTPVRAFYDLRSYVLKNQKSPIHRYVARLWIYIHRYFDQRSIKNVNKIVTNSKNTLSRIKKHHKRDATVIYPPVPTDKYKYRCNGPFWLSVNRLYPEKRVPLQVEVFRQLPNEKLKIIGWYSEGDHAKEHLGYLSELPGNVEILGSVSEEELRDLYANCKGFICTAMDEDFGMTPVEAMAAGKPVVAVDEGGYKESVVDGITGRLVEPNVECIVKAIRGISEEGSAKYKEACKARAKLFDEGIFVQRMREEIDNGIKAQSGNR